MLQLRRLYPFLDFRGLVTRLLHHSWQAKPSKPGSLPENTSNRRQRKRKKTSTKLATSCAKTSSRSVANKSPSTRHISNTTSNDSDPDGDFVHPTIPGPTRKSPRLQKQSSKPSSSRSAVVNKLTMSSLSPVDEEQDHSACDDEPEDHRNFYLCTALQVSSHRQPSELNCIWALSGTWLQKCFMQLFDQRMPRKVDLLGRGACPEDISSCTYLSVQIFEDGCTPSRTQERLVEIWAKHQPLMVDLLP
ncbi:hypothetical protein ACP70R_008524 [Stipagrostis hirtigluma subsp. patula]